MTRAPNRIHLLAHANPITKDIARFGFADLTEYLRFVREHVEPGYRVTARKSLLTARVDPRDGNRHDDRARVRDLQNALDDPNTLAIVALNGGKYFSRILPDVDFSGLARRRTPLVTLGYSEMTNLVNLVASYRCGRGVYWLCPNSLAWMIKPRSRARETFAAFWSGLAAFVERIAQRRGGRPRGAPDGSRAQVAQDRRMSLRENRSLAQVGRAWVPATAGRDACSTDCFPSSIAELFNPVIEGKLLRGRPAPGRVTLIGGCLSVFCVNLAGQLARRVKPDGRWLVLEDINEEIYRIDRFFAALKLAGWFERVAGVVLADFHSGRDNQLAAVAALLKHHLPPPAQTPVIAARSLGHVWPMRPLEINQPLQLKVRGTAVRITP